VCTGTSDLTGQMIGAFASAAIVQSKLNQTDGENGTYYKTLMDAANTLYITVPPPLHVFEMRRRA